MELNVNILLVPVENANAWLVGTMEGFARRAVIDEGYSIGDLSWYENRRSFVSLDIDDMKELVHRMHGVLARIRLDQHYRFRAEWMAS